MTNLASLTENQQDILRKCILSSLHNLTEVFQSLALESEKRGAEYNVKISEIVLEYISIFEKIAISSKDEKIPSLNMFAMFLFSSILRQSLFNSTNQISEELSKSLSEMSNLVCERLSTLDKLKKT